jgi:hypothetical protein
LPGRSKIGACKLYSSNLVIETDCASIMDYFKETSCNPSEVSLIAKELSFLKPLDPQVIMGKVDRSCNRIAHNLCQLNRSVLCGGVFQVVGPIYMLKVIWKILINTLFLD